MTPFSPPFPSSDRLPPATTCSDQPRFAAPAEHKGSCPPAHRAQQSKTALRPPDRRIFFGIVQTETASCLVHFRPFQTGNLTQSKTGQKKQFRPDDALPDFRFVLFQHLAKGAYSFSVNRLVRLPTAGFLMPRAGLWGIIPSDTAYGSRSKASPPEMRSRPRRSQQRAPAACRSSHPAAVLPVVMSRIILTASPSSAPGRGDCRPAARYDDWPALDIDIERGRLLGLAALGEDQPLSAASK